MAWAEASASQRRLPPPHLPPRPTQPPTPPLFSASLQDIFGREKFADSLDNRKGAGSYERDTHTLYVQYSGAGHIPLPQLRPLLEANFGEWGPLQVRAPGHAHDRRSWW
jgi:hypothetical protein